MSGPLPLPRPAARPLRVGVLGAARFVRRARDFAFDVGIPAASATYADLVAADDVDIVYNPLPASLHAEWSIAALRAGRHVLCENPISPQRATKLVIETVDGRTVGPVGAGNSYVHMWRAFADHVAHGTPFVTSGDDAVANMAAIDTIYRAAGLPPRSS